MRHRVYGKHLGRTKNQRTALFKGLARSLILHESINTTSAKAKAIKGFIDRLIVKAKSNTNPSRQFILATLPEKEINKKLIEVIAPRYTDRNSGFTNIVRLGSRVGDGAMMVKMSLVSEGSESQKIGKSRPKDDQPLAGEDQKTSKPEEVEEKEEKKQVKKVAKKATKKEDKE